MKNFRNLIVLVGAALAIGCDTGETPVETVQVQPGTTKSPTPGEPPQNMQSAIQSNPGMPQVAKDAVLGKK